MSPVPVARQDASATRPAGPATSSFTSTSASTSATPTKSAAGSATAAIRVARRALPASATDDEILEISAAPGAKAAAAKSGDDQRAFDFDAEDLNRPPADQPQGANVAAANEPENLRAVLEANPELRQAWQDAGAYRETFATPEEARAATAQLADLDRMDALFFSRRPEDHAQLARSIATLDPAAFASLAQAMAQLTPPAASHGREREEANPAASTRSDSRADVRAEAAVAAARNREPEQNHPASEAQERREAAASAQHERSESGAHADFLQAANAEAVQSVLGAIESQVERLLPDGVSKSARNRVVGEIYRELDSALQSNRQFGQQMREAFRSGALDAGHQRAIVSLITGRARQVLPGVAKRVLGEWTSTVVAANHDRRARQRAAEGRVDIAGSGSAGNEGRRSMAPRDIDYARMSDAEILNL